MLPSLQKATLTAYNGDRDTSGICHGYGQAQFSSGQTYEGEWSSSHGHMHGQGLIQYPDGIAFQGSFQGNSISGTGTYTWAEGLYEGGVLEGLRHGYGKLTVSDSPVTYEGQWQHGKRHGLGALYYNQDRTAYYEGTWCDDLKQGQGTSVYPSGNVYTGQWREDQRHGHGTMQWLTTSQQYTGQWLHRLPDGFGEHVWWQQKPAAGQQVSNHAMHVRHNRYVGMFKAGQRHGPGTLFYSTGARYEGGWQQGKKHGQGVYVFEDGSHFSGQFVDDRAVLSSGAVLGAANTFASGGGNNSSSSSSSSSSSTGQSTPKLAAAAANQSACKHGPCVEATFSSAAADAEALPGGMHSVSVAAEPPGAAGATSTSMALEKPPSAKAGGNASKRYVPAAKSQANPKASTSQTSLAPAAAATAAKRLSTAATATASANRPAATDVSAEVQAVAADVVSSGGGPGFGPPVSVMQLYITDLLQQYDAQPAATYKAVSNLLVAYNTELRSLYDRYSAVPAALLDHTNLSISWGMQACQLWELLRDAGLMCRHVSLHHVGSMVALATSPPPAVLHYRQQVLSAGAPKAADLQHVWAAGSPNQPGVQLLFRDFCEVLVRLAAARYPLLSPLEAQVQQVIGYHLLPLLSVSTPTRQLVSASRTAMLAAGGAADGAAAAAAAGGGGGVSSSIAGNGGCEQQLRSPEVVQYLQGKLVLLQQLFTAMASCSLTTQHDVVAAAAVSEGDTNITELQPPAGSVDPEAAAPHAAVVDAGQGAVLCPQVSVQGGACCPATASVQGVVLCMQEAGVLHEWQLSADVVAACMLHGMLAGTDPQEARACIEQEASEGSCAADVLQPDSCSVNSSGTSPQAPGSTMTAAVAALQHELLFWADAPLILQDVLWGLVRLAAVLPTACKVLQPLAEQAGDAASAQQQPQQPQAVQRPAQQPCKDHATAVSAAVQLESDKTLYRYWQLFAEGSKGNCQWEPSMLLLHLTSIVQSLLEAVLGLADAGKSGNSSSVQSGQHQQQQQRQTSSILEQEAEQEAVTVALPSEADPTLLLDELNEGAAADTQPDLSDEGDEADA